MGSFVQLTSADGFHCPAYVAQPAGQRFMGLTGFTGIRPVQAQDLKFLDDHVEVTRRSLAGA